jgi:segregation and condensation protein B
MEPAMADENHADTGSPDDSGRTYAELLGDGGWPGPLAASQSAQGDADIAPPSPLRIIEAMLFIGGTALTATRACEAIRGLSAEQFEQAIAELTRTYRRQNRPYVVVPHDHGYLLALRPRYEPLADKLQGGMREARLSVAAVDVLALVAYRQPITKREVDSLRGLESGSLLRQLVRRGLVQIIQMGNSKREIAYGTTPRFLELFGLRSLDDLPRTRDLQ